MRRHPEILLFGAIATIYTICCAPDLTWINVNCDSFWYYEGAKFLVSWETHPAYKLLGHLAMYFPFGTDGWKLAFFLAVLPAVGTSILIFYVVKKQTQNRLAPYVGSLAFAGSTVVISQSTVQDIYSLATFFLIASYTCLVYNKPKLAALTLGLAFCSHWMIIIPASIVFMLWSRELRRQAHILLLLFVFPLAAAYFLSPDIFDYWVGLRRVFFLVAVTEIPGRFVDTIRIVVVSSGLALIPACLYLKKLKTSWPLLVIIAVPILYLLTCFTNEGYVQTYVTTAFVAVAAGLGIEQLRTKHLEKVILVTSAIMLLIMPAFWDIGKTIDETPTTAKQWLDQLDEVPNGSVILCVRYVGERGEFYGDTIGGLNRPGVGIYNRENERGRTLHYLFPTYYMNEVDFFGERARLREVGLVTPNPVYVGNSYGEIERATLRAFAEANGDVKCYYTHVSRPEVFGCELVELK